MSIIELYSVNDKAFSKSELDKIVALAIEAGFKPLNGVPRTIRGKAPYLSFHFIACDDVPDHQ